MAPAELTRTAVSSAVAQRQDEAGAGHPYAQCRRRLLAEREGVERTGVTEADEQDRGEDGRAQPYVRPARPAERAEQPEQDAAGGLRVARGEDDERRQRGEELHRGDARQDDAVRRAAECVAQQEDEREGAERTHEGARRDRQRSPADAEDDDRDRPGRRPGGHPEDEGVGEGVAEQGLHDGAADREARAADAASRVRGSRRFQTMPSRRGVSPASPQPRCAARAEKTSGTEMSAGSMVTATAIERTSAAPPASHSSPCRAAGAAGLTSPVRTSAARRPLVRCRRPCGSWGSWPGR